MSKKQLTALLLTVAAALSLTVLAITASAAAVEPKDIDKYVVDFRTEADFLQKARVYVHAPSEKEPDPNTGGLYKFDTEKSAMQVLYAESDKQTDHRLMLRMTALAAEYKYWVIVYSAKTGSSYDIYLHNTPKQGVQADVIKGGKDTGGKFTVSDPIDISIADANGKSIMSRWAMNANINTLNFKTDDKNAEFYIKEFGFFKTAEDARAYYAAVDLEKPSSQYSTDIAPTIPKNEADFIVPFTPTKVDEPKATAEPYVLKLGTKLEMSAQNAAFYEHGDNITEGRYEAVTEDGVSCLKLAYAEATESKLPQYRTMIKFPRNTKLTEAHKFIRVTYKTDTKQLAEFVLVNNANRTIIPTLAANAAVSDGRFVRTNAVSIDEGGFLKRFLNGIHCTFGFMCASKVESFYISEIGFFTSPEQAYDYYGDTPRADSVGCVRMSFGEGGTGTTLDGETYGVHTFNESTKALDITYAEKTNADVSYMAKIKFNKEVDYSPNMRYMRVLYAADNPDGITNASMYLRTDAHHHVFLLEDKIEDTNGSFVLSDTAYLSDVAVTRFAGTGDYKAKIHNSLIVNCTKPGGKYSVKAVFFFGSRAEADAFVYDDTPSNITVNGVDIGKYKIVISRDEKIHSMYAAEKINAKIYELASVNLPIVDDSSPVSEYEIVIGKTNRQGADISNYFENELSDELFCSYAVEIKGSQIIITSYLPSALSAAADDFIRLCLYGASISSPRDINITDSRHISSHAGIRQSKYFGIYSNQDDPKVFTDDFDTDDGFWQEEYNNSNWQFKDGAYTVKAAEGEYSYLHVYEQNAEFNAKIKYADAGKNGDIALMLRQNSDLAWIKAGYDFTEGVWYVDSREGADFYLNRLIEKKANIIPDKWYEISLKADGETVSLYVDDVLIGESGGATHISPGKIAFYAEDITAAFDDADITLLSGEGTIMKNTYHTYLNPDKWLAGGTVIEMLDGSLRYIYSDTVNLVSYDKGLTWEECDKLFDALGTQPNIIRLNSGELIRMGKKDGSIVFFISEDDAKTWKQTGTVCPTTFRSDKSIDAGAVNMNDKLTQSPTTDRIFYSQNYETTTSTFEGRKVFCEFYYSDDKGYTWTKSETDSWEIVGNEKTTHFGECKILECADGTLRMYNSWNKYGCIVYSESTDNGATWGPLVEMPELKCSLSSAQFVRDPYADNDHTYYMVLVYSVDNKTNSMPRSRLSILRSTDGKEWRYLGDLWRWESGYLSTDTSSTINHIVNPFIYVTKDYVFCGSGTSERMAKDSGSNFHQAQRQNIWTVDKSTLGEGILLNVFDDVKLTDEAYSAVSFVTSEGLFNGMSENLFAPEVTMNRSMFVTVLGRLDKADVSAYTAPTFTDVVAGQWYTPYVEWAGANGIVNGMGDGTYGINGAVTVEQACTILYRYADNGKNASSPTGKSLDDYTDASSVSSWAADSMKWAVENGIYKGKGGFLDPTAAASRALVASMFANYVKAAS